jgi:hypothetical protein
MSPGNSPLKLWRKREREIESCNKIEMVISVAQCLLSRSPDLNLKPAVRIVSGKLRGDSLVL